MNTAGYGNIPRELFHWITFLCKVLPLRSVGTFIELLIGSMLTPTGFVTDAYLMLDMRNHWTSYYKWLQNGRWSWLALARQFVRLILRTVKADVVHLVIDDTLTLRASKKHPAARFITNTGINPTLLNMCEGNAG
ncbi:MAG: transposase [Gammaproteobacteria bacterium]|nr:transposase [Gammaproteobacteria bacterium]